MVMNLRTTIAGGSLSLLMISFGCMDARAQSDPQEPVDSTPKPAARSTPIPPIDSGQDDSQNSSNQLQADTAPLTGVQTPTLGSAEMRHSYWVPGIQYANNIQSGQYNQTNSPGWYIDNYILGNLSLVKAWSHSQLTVNDSGGGIFSSNNQRGSSWTEQLALAQSVQ